MAGPCLSERRRCALLIKHFHRCLLLRRSYASNASIVLIAGGHEDLGGLLAT